MSEFHYVSSFQWPQSNEFKSGAIMGHKFYIAWKVVKYRVFSDLNFPLFGLIRKFTPKILVFRPNKEKYGLQKTTYLDTFYTMLVTAKGFEEQSFYIYCS